MTEDLIGFLPHELTHLFQVRLYLTLTLFGPKPVDSNALGILLVQKARTLVLIDRFLTFKLAKGFLWW